MQYLWQHLENILRDYDGSLPLHHYLKSHFKANPKLGSRDRRGLSDAVYAWYRAGKALSTTTQDTQKLRLAAMELSGLKPKAFASYFPEAWQSAPGLEHHGFSVDLNQIFPHNIALSEGVSLEEYRASMLRQPRMFLRIRTGKNEVTQRLIAQDIPHEWLSDTCLALPNSTKIEGVLPDEAYVVQDASSQSTGKYLVGTAGDHWWDSCAGAGGKSLMLVDSSTGVQLLATDIRQTILQNLADRFKRYKLPIPERKVLDASNQYDVAKVLGTRGFHGIICDVPCSGSGTWARTPESCYFFKPDSLKTYTDRQYAILGNASQYLSKRGQIIYITCSVFRSENEDVVEAIAKEKGLDIKLSELINGMPIGADSLYVAVLQKA
jgi:16S rRNA (cytosine967-C5)-methyltransferase